MQEELSYLERNMWCGNRSYIHFTFLLISLLDPTWNCIISSHGIEISDVYTRTKSKDDLISSKIEWLRANGGYFNPKMQLGSLSSDSDSAFGFYAASDIETDEILLSIPPTVFLTDVRRKSRKQTETVDLGPEGNGVLYCRTVRNLIHEMKLGDKSFYAPYVNYLMDLITDEDEGLMSRVPSGWSQKGKELLDNVLGVQSDGSSIIPPMAPTEWIVDDWYGDCEAEPSGEDGQMGLEEKAALQVISRSWDQILLPVMDMIAHRNGDQYYNTKSNSVHGDVPVVLRASKPISKGSGIHTSYNQCEDCDLRHHTYGSAEMFRDYGFVEQYPQRWIFQAHEIIFDVEEAIGEDEEHLNVKFINGSPNYLGVKHMESMMSYLEEVHKKYLVPLIYSFDKGGVPEQEFNAIVNYHKSVETALQLAFKTIMKEEENFFDASEYEDESDVCTTSPDSCSSTSGTKKKRADAVLFHYYHEDLLIRKTKELDLNIATCDKETNMLFDGYEMIEDVNSTYHDFNFFYNEETDDLCFDIQNTVQICSNYRPQYHEIIVHYTGRFLSAPPSPNKNKNNDKTKERTGKINRVLWVGGGDSMLLHEILKYYDVEENDLELVIGLELDQQITRKSFQYFGSQPHWDNHELVQWWFGDATKSLLMLPSEYFGTFDMVLVDLSETVMSFRVTDSLDILEALALLLKPNGIMVKNEFYFEPMNKIFEHVAQIYYYDVPVICSQALSLGSFATNFVLGDDGGYVDLNSHTFDNYEDFRSSATDEEETQPFLFVEPNSKEYHYSLLHDYSRNKDNLKTGHDKNVKSKTLSEQTESPGILMVVDAENAMLVTQPIENIKKKLHKLIEIQGFTILNSFLSDVSKGNIYFVLKEGYVSVSVNTKSKYCGFDIHLWSSFEKQNDLKKSLIEGVKSSYAPVVHGSGKKPKMKSNSSSFRIVAGGMFGVSTWKEDAVKRGPPSLSSQPATEIKKEVDPKKDVDSATVVSPTIDIIQEFLNTLIISKVDDKDESIYLVICGSVNESDCSSVKAVEELAEIKKENIQVVNSCDDLPSQDTPSDDFTKLVAMTSCEKSLISTLDEATSEQNKVAYILLDPSASLPMTQIVYKVFRKILKRVDFLTDDDIFIIAPQTVSSGDEDDIEEWRGNFVNMFRKEIIEYDPVSTASVSLSSSSSTQTKLEYYFDILSTQKTFKVLLQESLHRIKSITQLEPKVHKILGGQVLWRPNISPEHTYELQDYATPDALLQYNSQIPLAHQFLFQMEFQGKFESLDLSKTSKYITKALKGAIMNYSKKNEMKNFSPDFLNADGSLHIAMFTSPSHKDHRVALLWDGRKHIDLNLVLPSMKIDDNEGKNKELAKSFHDLFKTFMIEQFTHADNEVAGKFSIETILRDENPRGIGRVVNYEYDIFSKMDHKRFRPYWA